MNQKLYSMTRVSVIAFISILLVTSLAIAPFASAATLSNASLELSDPRPNQTADYTFSAGNFTTGTALQCIDVALNDQADGGGSAPAGINTSSFTLSSSDVITVADWDEDTSTSGLLRIENSTGEAPAASGELVFSGIQNGNTTDTYYAIVTTYSNAGCSTQVDSVTVAFAYTDGTLVELSIEPTLTFVTAPVLEDGIEEVNDQLINTDSTGTGIDFGNAVTASLNGVAAHDLQISTNATGGYTVYIRHTGQLSNGSDTIADHTGTNGTPTAFPSPGNEAWGYTTEQLFGSNLWAGFTTSNEPVVQNATATISTETTRVGHQVGIEATTPAGTYQTTVVYTVVSTY